MTKSEFLSRRWLLWSRSNGSFWTRTRNGKSVVIPQEGLLYNPALLLVDVETNERIYLFAYRTLLGKLVAVEQDLFYSTNITAEFDFVLDAKDSVDRDEVILGSELEHCVLTIARDIFTYSMSDIIKYETNRFILSWEHARLVMWFKDVPTENKVLDIQLKSVLNTGRPSSIKCLASINGVEVELSSYQIFERFELYSVFDNSGFVSINISNLLKATVTPDGDVLCSYKDMKERKFELSSGVSLLC